MDPMGADARGVFITFEGGEGTGKTTQVARLAAALERHGITAVTTREPGGTAGAEAIRTLVLDGAEDRWDPLCEAMLVSAARRDHIRRIIAPALASARWVLCDRFVDSTTVYQGFARGGNLAAITQINALAVDGTMPDLTLVLDAPLDTTADRRLRRAASTTPPEATPGAARQTDGKDRFERRDPAFHQRLRRAFINIAETNPARCVVIDAAAPIDTVAAEIWATVRHRFDVGLRLP